METTTIYETVHGSQAYGLAREGSDLDVKGVVVGPKAWYFGYRGGPEQVELGTGELGDLPKDHVAFEVRKLLRLLANANPTVLELLFVDADFVRVCTAEGRLLLDFRERFLTRKVGESFGGYALGQLRRIQTHRKWLLSPPKEAPTRAAFGLSERPTIPKDQLGAAETLLERGAFPDEAAGFLDTLAREKRFESAKKQWQQFQQWKRERNEARAALEAKHGYDTKHAMHLVRLQRMGLEILTRREVIVRRPDREELLGIRDGAWPFEKLLEEAERMAQAIRDAVPTSALPETVDEDAAEALGVAIVERVLFA
ncbi:MAG: nucleotidyltransferase domain-containing protein [Sandaracinus sp.]|nr:nucleotidyltransferase domain-containing protein [Sandaracinus sp.]MCB9618262.1 nucleotidyltransferase domain-containing protein [Sandaracinus sp.]